MRSYGSATVSGRSNPSAEGWGVIAIHESEHHAPVNQQRVRQVIEEVLRTGTVTAGSDGSVHQIFPVAADPVEGEALRDWVVREGAVQTIEVGLGYGISALYICEGSLVVGNEAAHHVAIDPYQDTRFAGLGLQLLDEAGVADLVEHHAEESQVVLPRLLSEGRRFDLAFVDGNHRFDWVFVDLYFLGRLVCPGGVIFLDDYQLPSVRRATSFFVINLGWTHVFVSNPDVLHRWAVLRTSPESDDRQFDHFIDF